MTVFNGDGTRTLKRRQRQAMTLVVENLSTEKQGPYSFVANGGECLAITGESGIGKSVLLKMIADLIPHQGDAVLNSCSCSFMKPSEWRKKVTYVAAETGWWGDCVRDHLRDLEWSRKFLVKLNLKENLLDMPVNQLSTGEKQRMGLLRALSPEVDFLLLDEITSALDPKSVQMVEDLITEFKRWGVGIILVSHNMDQVSRLADQHCQLTAQNLLWVG